MGETAKSNDTNSPCLRGKTFLSAQIAATMLIKDTTTPNVLADASFNPKVIAGTKLIISPGGRGLTINP
jgi:phosphate starvation-inducible protein PhoH